MHGVTRSPVLLSSIMKLLLLNNCLIYFKVSFNKTFLESTGNIATYLKHMGSENKWYTYEPDYSKAEN